LRSRAGLPLLTIDLDGVVCAPQFGVNLGIHRTFLDPSAPPPRAAVPLRWFSRPIDHLRFDLRRPLPGVREALTELREVRRLVLLTGRRSSPRHWLRRHGLEALLDEIVINASPLRSPHYKLDAVVGLGASEHVDDDGRTVQLLAQRSSVVPFVRDWPRNRGLPFDPRVRRVGDLGELARVLRLESADAR